MRARRPPHPLEHHASFRAVIAAAPPLAELATRLRARERAAAEHRAATTRTETTRAATEPHAAPPRSGPPRAATEHRAATTRTETTRAATEPHAAPPRSGPSRAAAEHRAPTTRTASPSSDAERGLGGPEAADLVGALAIACGDLADGFAAPPESRRRITAHHRAWIAVREIDRAVTAAARRRLAPPEIVRRAQRAIDRADVLIGALLPA